MIRQQIQLTTKQIKIISVITAIQWIIVFAWFITLSVCLYNLYHQTDNYNIDSTFEDQKKQIKTLNTTQSDLISKNEKLEIKINDFKTIIDKQIYDLEKELINQDEIFEKTIKELKVINEKLTKQVIDMEEQINKLICKIELPKTNIEFGQVGQRIADLEFNSIQFQNQNKLLNSQLNNLNTTMIIADSRQEVLISELKIQIKGNYDQIVSLKEYNQNQDQLFTKKDDELNKSITNLNSVVIDTQTQIKDHDGKILALKDYNLQQDATFSKKNDDLNKCVISLNSDISSLNTITKLHTLQLSDLQSYSQSQIKDHESKILALKDQDTLINTTFSKKNDDLNSKIILLSSDVSSLNATTIASYKLHSQQIQDLQYDVVSKFTSLNNTNTIQDKSIKDNNNQIQLLNSTTTQNIIKILDQQNNQNTFIQQLNASTSEQTLNISDLFRITKDLKLEIDKTQKMEIYGTYNSDQWWWQFSTSGGKTNIPIHPYFSKLPKIKINKKSLIMFTINGHIQSSTTCTVMLMKDGKPVEKEYVETYSYYYNSYLSLPKSSDGWESMNFVQEIISEIGEFQFGIGVACITAASVNVNGAGISIKVIDLLS